MNKNDEIDPQPPPIPPRRKKRKDNLSTSVNSEPTLKPSSKPRKKPRLPPPPPPPVHKRHLIKNSQHLTKMEPDVQNNSFAEVNSENVSLLPYRVAFNVSGGDKDTEVLQNHFENKNCSQNQSACTYRPQSGESNRYPSLLFTFQDFQSVMGESTINANEGTSPEETFSSNNLIDESKVCFRVTTTNLPFEKCLGTWQNSFDNPEFENYEENLFIFEDYLDRTKRINARPDLFRMESLENAPEDFVPNTSKVRFVIESPSNSTPDDNTDITIDSLQNLESLNKDIEELEKMQTICEAIQHSKEKCENGNVAFDSLLCDRDDFNLIEIASQADLICEKRIETEEQKEENSEVSKDLSSIEGNHSFNGMIATDSKITYIDEISSTNEISTNTSGLAKLQRYETCLSSDNVFIQGIPVAEISKEESSEKRTKFSKIEAFKSQRSKSDSYEDACDSEEFVQTGGKNLEISEDKDIENSADKDVENSEDKDVENLKNSASDKNIVESIRETSKEKKLFIDSSLCDFINNDNDNLNWNSSSDEEKETESVSKSEFKNNTENNISNILNLKNNPEDNLKSGNVVINPNFEKNLEDKIDPIINPQKSVPLSVRRISFLDKMLNEETSCEVIAIHRKADESKPEKKILSTSPEIKAKQEFPVLSSNLEKTVVKRSSGIDKNLSEKIPEKKKSVGEAKCDLLNELLCNFSAIKLKSVASIKNVDCDSSGNLVKFVDKSACEQKTDELRAENDGSASAKVTDPSEALAAVRDRIVSVDKCAIARRSPKTCNNSIDNNAKTPVALSIDQSHDAFSITPGSVRNFIKNFEIQQECCKAKDLAKHKESDPKDKESDSKNNENHSKDMENDSKNKEIDFKDKENDSKAKEMDSKDKENDSKAKEMDSKDKENDSKAKENDSKDKENDSKAKENDSKDKEHDSKIKENDSQDKKNDSKTKESDLNDMKEAGQDETSKLSAKEKPETPEQKRETDQNSVIDLVGLEGNDMSRCKSLEVIVNSKQESGSCFQISTAHGPGGRRHSCIKSNDSSPVSELKKSVQFDSACTVYQLQKHEESSKSSLINGIRSRIKGKAPNKPEMQMPITFKTLLRSDDSTPEVQKESEVQKAGNTSNSGTDHLDLKSENPRHNQSFVFYCKV